MTKKQRSTINRANAQKSTGPITDEGKAASSANSYRHGLTAQTLRLSDEEKVEYDRLHSELEQDLKPVGEAETLVVRRIADCHFRLQRILVIESDILLGGGAHPADAWLANDNSLEKLGRYEARIIRHVTVLSKELTRLQDLRKPPEEPVQAKQTKEDRLKSASIEFKRRPWTIKPVEENGKWFMRSFFEDQLGPDGKPRPGEVGQNRRPK